jgi:uncharacterized membrane protein YhaH (DUF805 family)
MTAFLESNGRVGRGLFAFRFFATLIVWAALATASLHYVGYAWPRAYQIAQFKADEGKAPEAPVASVAGAPAKPQAFSEELAGYNGHGLWQVSAFMAIVISIFGLGVTLIQVINRLRDIGWHGWLCLILLLPLVNILLLTGGYRGGLLEVVMLPVVLFIGALLFLPGKPARADAHGH